MAHEWFLKPKLMPPDRQESRHTKPPPPPTTTTCQHFLTLTVTQAGFQMKTTAGFPLFFGFPSFSPFFLWQTFLPHCPGGGGRSLTLQSKGQTG